MEFVLEILGVLTAIIVLCTAYIKYKEVKAKVSDENKDGNNGNVKSITIGDSSTGNIAVNADGDVEISTDSNATEKVKR